MNQLPSLGSHAQNSGPCSSVGVSLPHNVHHVRRIVSRLKRTFEAAPGELITQKMVWHLYNLTCPLNSSPRVKTRTQDTTEPLDARSFFKTLGKVFENARMVTTEQGGKRAFVVKNIRQVSMRVRDQTGVSYYMAGKVPISANAQDSSAPNGIPRITEALLIPSQLAVAAALPPTPSTSKQPPSVAPVIRPRPLLAAPSLPTMAVNKTREKTPLCFNPVSMNSNPNENSKLDLSALVVEKFPALNDNSGQDTEQETSVSFETTVVEPEIHSPDADLTTHSRDLPKVVEPTPSASSPPDSLRPRPAPTDVLDCLHEVMDLKSYNDYLRLNLQDSDNRFQAHLKELGSLRDEIAKVVRNLLK